MRTAPALLLVLGLAAAAPARAQAPATALPIPLPPGASVQMELDGRDADLLGMVKSLLAGTAAPKTGPDAATLTVTNPFFNFLDESRLTALLKDIHHLHVVSFKPADALPAPPRPPTIWPSTRSPSRPKAATGCSISTRAARRS